LYIKQILNPQKLTQVTLACSKQHISDIITEQNSRMYFKKTQSTAC